MSPKQTNKHRSPRCGMFVCVCFVCMFICVYLCICMCVIILESQIQFFKNLLVIILCVYVSACMYVCVACICFAPLEFQRRHQIP